VTAGIAAAVVPFEDLVRDRREIARVIIHRAAEVGDALLRPLPVPFADDVFDFHPYHGDSSAGPSPGRAVVRRPAA
jgi:hypothetical protein